MPEETPPTNTPPPPALDATKIAQEAARAAVEAVSKGAEERATRMANEKLSAIGKALTGEKAPRPQEQVLDLFVKDPVGTISAAIDSKLQRYDADRAAVQRIADTQRSVVLPYINEYPELNSTAKLAMVEKLADNYSADGGMSYDAALDKACKEAVKEFGLKSVSDAQRSSGYQHGMPGGGGVSSGAPRFDEAKSQSDFLSGMQSRLQSFRKRTTS